MYQPVKRDLNGVPKFCYTTWVPGTVLGTGERKAKDL